MYLTLSQIVERGIPERTIATMRNSGEIHPVKFGTARQSRVRFDADELQRALDLRAGRESAALLEAQIAAAEVEHKRYKARREYGMALQRYRDVCARATDSTATPAQRLEANAEAEQLRKKFRL